MKFLASGFKTYLFLGAVLMEEKNELREGCFRDLRSVVKMKTLLKTDWKIEQAH